MDQPMTADGPANTPMIVTLDDTSGLDRAELGGKAWELAALRAAGRPVPPGVVLSASFVRTAGADELARAAELIVTLLGDVRFAVRSSAVAEDRADASFAGLYESVLDVERSALVAAIDKVVASASSARIGAYASEAVGGAIAVLVQPMVPAEAAGVAFSADPLTGQRGVVVISAVSGTGDRLVSGEADGEDWIVDHAGARRRSGRDPVITAVQASRIAALVVDVAHGAEHPQDVEWAIVGSTVHVLQARPMTALPDPVAWTIRDKAPFWRRDFRMAEWLPDPVTPLFATWFLPEHDHGFALVQREEFGGAMQPPFNVVVNGWCYSGIGRPSASVAIAFAKHPLRFVKWTIAFASALHGKNPARAERWMAAPTWELHERRLDREHRACVELGMSVVDTAPLAGLPPLVDETLHRVGALSFPLVECAGFAWKAECALARFFDEHLRPSVNASPQELLAGLRQPVVPAAHAVSTFDWSQPTLGECDEQRLPPSPERYRELVARREDAERRCRDALAGTTLRKRFDEYLEIAQRYAVLREEFMADVTLSWPLLRRALLRIGHHAVDVGTIDTADDVFWLVRDEVNALVAGDTTWRGDVVSERRSEWSRQRRLDPPLWIGKPGHSTKVLERFARHSGGTPDATGAAVVGVPASPGRATGAVRIVRGPDDFAMVQPGEVLVAPLTAPAWTPLFARVAAVVTDGGSLAAHASLIAREYGIPAVVATHNGTSVLTDGSVVTVDGNRGTVTLTGR